MPPRSICSPRCSKRVAGLMNIPATTRYLAMCRAAGPVISCAGYGGLKIMCCNCCVCQISECLPKSAPPCLRFWRGHFDIWSNGGILLYRHGHMLGDDGMLSPAQAQLAVEAAIEECDRFYPAFQFILWGDKTPAEALAAALVDAAGEA
jgi:hypothetical protein